MSDLSTLFTWIDAAYIVHTNMQSQTGGTISMGHSVLHYKSAKYKLNVESSREADLAGARDYVTYNL